MVGRVVAESISMRLIFFINLFVTFAFGWSPTHQNGLKVRHGIRNLRERDYRPAKSERLDNDHADSSVDTPAQHLTIPELLSEYGLVALLFHFTVWSMSLTFVFTLLSAGVDLRHLPAFLAFLTTSSGEEASSALLSTGNEVAAAGAKAVFLGRLGASLALVEVVGPLRLALTVTMTPPVSKHVRKFASFRNAEAKVAGWLSKAQSTFKRKPSTSPTAKE